MARQLQGVDLLAAGRQQSKEQVEKARIMRDLYYFCTEHLEYDALSPEFHGPMLARWDAIDAARFRGKKRDLCLDLWPRDHIKTWCLRARVLRYYLWDPTVTVTWWHAVEESACDSAVAVGKHLQYNTKLRKFFPPGVLPSASAKRFLGGRGFRLRSCRTGDDDSMMAFGAGSEATGRHSLIGVLDDVIGANDIADSQLPTKSRWYRDTACNVVRMAKGWMDAVGTRWDEGDLWGEFLASPDWNCIVRSARETEGKMDYQGRSVYLPEEILALKERQLGASFPYQMMNDAAPKKDLPWNAATCEHEIGVKEAAGHGVVVILSDPAPAQVGSWRADTRALGLEKDYLATAAVKIRTNGQRVEIILLDGAASRDWPPDEGFRRMCQMGRRWGASYYAIEKTGQAVAFYTENLRRVAREEGVRYSPADLSLTYDGKNEYFSRLAERAKRDEFLIADSVPQEFRDMFLAQARAWRPVGKKNSLKYDDAANVVSFATDPEVLRLAPRPEVVAAEWNPFQRPEPETDQGSLRVRW